jgi:predicted PurR-regulated permease PerM
VELGYWLGLIALVLSLYILWQIRQLVLLVFAAVVLATALNMLARRLQRFGISRSFAIILSIAALFALCILFFWLIVPPFIEQFDELTQQFPRVLAKLNQWLDALREIVPGNQIEEYLPDLTQLLQRLQPLANDLLERGFSVFSGTLGVALNLLLLVVWTLMLLADPPSYRQIFIRLFPAFYRRRIDEILTQCEGALGGWLVGRLINMLAIAVLSWLSLWLILRVDLALAHGVLAGVLAFMPHIGPALSVLPPMAIALLDNPLKPVAVLVTYIIIQQLESHVLYPYVKMRQVWLLPGITLCAQVFFASFFGFLGLLLALPLAVVGQVWLQEVLVKDVLNRWNGDRVSSTNNHQTEPSEALLPFDEADESDDRHSDRPTSESEREPQSE